MEEGGVCAGETDDADIRNSWWPHATDTLFFIYKQEHIKITRIWGKSAKCMWKNKMRRMNYWPQGMVDDARNGKLKTLVWILDSEREYKKLPLKGKIRAGKVFLKVKRHDSQHRIFNRIDKMTCHWLK